MPKLTDTQLVILSAAAQRDGGAVLPLSAPLSINKGAAAVVLNSLVKRGLIAERLANAGVEIWREGEEGNHLALAITETGLAAIGVELADVPSGLETKAEAKPKKSQKSGAQPSADTGVRTSTKQALLIDLLKRKSGATIDEVMEATGWQAHSVRGAISGALKKKLGLAVTSKKVNGRGRVYRIAAHG